MKKGDKDSMFTAGGTEGGGRCGATVAARRRGGGGGEAFFKGTQLNEADHGTFLLEIFLPKYDSQINVKDSFRFDAIQTFMEYLK